MLASEHFSSSTIYLTFSSVLISLIFFLLNTHFYFPGLFLFDYFLFVLFSFETLILHLQQIIWLKNKNNNKGRGV